MYYALYRKYRPLTFREVLGQEAVTTTLRRQVATGQISHAYLFTGTRGTGKTTCAKILARAVNCRDPHDGDPCNECDICKGLLDGTLYDVEEIDAASNNGVENIRQIREEVVYAPAAAKYKVYIIDEVHMLSPGAFNALLKTLEEPPAHAVFILATTEIHKVPATILSRCQRFDFLRLSKAELVKQFRGILEKEQKTMDDRSLDLVAELADGSSRDGLSILDKVIDLPDFEQVETVLGVIPRQRIYGLLDAIARQDTEALYRAVEESYNASADLGRLCTDLMDTMKDLMVFRTAKNAEIILEKNPSDADALRKLAEKFPEERILYSLRILQSTAALLPRSADKRADTEVCMLRLSRPELDPDTEALQARIATLEQTVKDLSARPVAAAPVPKSPKPASEPSEPVPEQPRPAPAPAPAAPKAEKRPPVVPVFDDPFADSSMTSVGTYRIPAENSAPAVNRAPAAPAEVSPAAPKPIRTDLSAGKAGQTDFVSGWERLTAWKDIAKTVSREDRLLGYVMESLPAVYQDHTILIPVEDMDDYTELKSARALRLIRDALAENRKEGYSVRIEHCKADRYIPNATMEQLKESDLFDFGDNDLPEPPAPDDTVPPDPDEE